MRLTVDVKIAKDLFLRQKFLLSQQDGVEDDLPAFHEQPHFTEPGQDFFFHLSGHAGLLCALSGRRMGIRVGRERAVRIRGFVESEAAANIIILFGQPRKNAGLFPAFDCLNVIFLHCQ